MRIQPPANLVSLLARLKLATAEQVASVSRRAARLAGELPDFESVWVDALAQARILTPYQAAEINAGRAESLVYGPYVVTAALAGPHWAECYRGRNVETGRPVRLYVVRRPQISTGTIVEVLSELLVRSMPLRSPVTSAVEDFGTSGELVWASCGAVEGILAAEWTFENGRLPPGAVLHIAREMVTRLAELERLEITHGDVGAAGLILQDSGHVVLPAPGLRGILRPHEGYSFSDLRPEAYDYLAPERIADGIAPTIASDMYACGCLWWQLSTGRVPFAGGNSLAKLKALHAARLVDVRQLAPDVPESVANAIESCLARDPGDRPQSFIELAERLGPTTRAGSSMLASLLSRPLASWQVVRHANHRKRRTSRQSQRAAGVVAVCVVLLVAFIPLWLLNRGGAVSTASIERSSPAVVAQVSPPAKTARTATREPQPTETSQPRIDPAVTPAAATLPANVRVSDDLVLPTDEVLRIEQLDLKPHTRVRGQGGRRAIVRVPTRGLLVACEDVTFEGIDFVWQDNPRGARLSAGAMLVVRAQTAAFRGCSFSTTDDVPPAAIAWSGAADGVPGPGGELTLRGCVCDGVGAVIDRRGEGGLSVTLDHSLCANSGPIVRLHRALNSNEPIGLTLEHVTLRGESSVLEYRYRRLAANLGQIDITANGSALAGKPDTALVVLAGSERPEPLAASLRWSGQGSIVTPQTEMVAWRSSARTSQVLAEEDLDIDGLVRSDLQFAGPIDGPPAASRVTRWQVPLRSADPPGANTRGLSLPRH